MTCIVGEDIGDSQIGTIDTTELPCNASLLKGLGP